VAASSAHVTPFPQPRSFLPCRRLLCI
jgi:hypothetical protein